MCVTGHDALYVFSQPQGNRCYVHVISALFARHVLERSVCHGEGYPAS